jgi:hypothetical protein
MSFVAISAFKFNKIEFIISTFYFTVKPSITQSVTFVLSRDMVTENKLMENMRSAYRILIGKVEGKKRFGRPRRR